MRNNISRIVSDSITGLLLERAGRGGAQTEQGDEPLTILTLTTETVDIKIRRLQSAQKNAARLVCILCKISTLLSHTNDPTPLASNTTVSCCRMYSRRCSYVFRAVLCRYGR